MKNKSFQGNLTDVFLFNIKGVLNRSCESAPCARGQLVEGARLWRGLQGLFAGRLTGPVLPDALVGIEMNT